MRLITLADTLELLSSMITPAILIAACGSLTISTSARLGRIVDRTRRIAEQIHQHHQSQKDRSDDWFSENLEQLRRSARRSRLLQHALSALYLALSFFMATSVIIGVVGILGVDYFWFPLVTGMIGAALLLYSSILLIVEARVALAAVYAETSYVLKSSTLLNEKSRRGDLK